MPSFSLFSEVAKLSHLMWNSKEPCGVLCCGIDVAISRNARILARTHHSLKSLKREFSLKLVMYQYLSCCPRTSGPQKILGGAFKTLAGIFQLVKSFAMIMYPNFWLFWYSVASRGHQRTSRHELNCKYFLTNKSVAKLIASGEFFWLENFL